MHVKQEKLCLHVLALPGDGKIKLSGFSIRIKRAYLLADPKHKSLEVKNEGRDILINLPDPVDTVIIYI